MSDIVNDEVEQAFREGFKAGSEQAEEYKRLLKETLPFVRFATQFSSCEWNRNADRLYDSIKKAIAR